MTDRGRPPYLDDPEAHALLGGIEESVIAAHGGAGGRSGAHHRSRRPQNG
jgi:hypothetical protein